MRVEFTVSEGRSGTWDVTRRGRAVSYDMDSPEEAMALIRRRFGTGFRVRIDPVSDPVQVVVS